MGSGERTDSERSAELARAWQAGDPAAFDAVYRAFASVLFGTAVGLVGDRTAAADVVHDTFLRAATRIGGLRDPSRLRPWLFAILRNEAVSWHRSRSRIAGGLDEGHREGLPVSEWLADDAPAADTELGRRELADLVWTAADGLQPRDREVLELHLRGGLEAADLGQVMGVTAGHAAVLLSRMRDRLERCLGAVLIARTGRADCAALDRLLADWDGRFSLAVRGTVTRHVESCATCGRRRTALVSLEHLAPAIVPPVVLVPDELRARLIADLSALPAGGPAGAGAAGPQQADPTGRQWAWREDGFPWPAVDPEFDELPAFGSVPSPRGRLAGGPRNRVAATVAGGLVLLGLLAVGTAWWWPGSDEVTVAQQVDPSVAAFPDVTSAPTSPAASGGPSLLASVAGAPDVDPTGRATTRPAGDPTRAVPSPTRRVASPTPSRTLAPSATPSGPSVSPTPTRPSDPPSPMPTPSPKPSRTPAPVGAPPQIVRAAAVPAQIMQSGCSPNTTTVQVVVRASSTVTGTARWQPVKGQTVTTTLKGGPTGVSGQIGPFTAAGTASVQVTVRDAQGRTDSATVTVTVTRCLVIL